MGHLRRLASALTCLLVFSAAARAEGPPDPLRLVPDIADVVVEIPQPRLLVESATNLEAFKELQKLDAVRDFYDSTTYRRFLKLIAYYEKELGAQWPELLDRLAGGGMVLGVKTGPNPAPFVLVVQAKDEKLMQRFAELSLQVLGQAAGEDSKDKLEKGSYRGVTVIHQGKEFHAAVAGGALLVSNVEEGLNRSINLHLDGPEKSITHVVSLAEARKLLPPNPLARVWFDLDTLHKGPTTKDLFTLPRNDVNLTVLFGGWLDVAGRAPYLCAGLYREKDGFRASVRMPAGRVGSNPGMALHIPPADYPGILPPLEPKGALYSSSFYMDIGRVWEDRTKMFNADQVKAFEKADKDAGRFLGGSQLNKLLTQVGANHRVVVANQEKSGYTIKPAQTIPAFAFLTEMREPEFAKSMDTVLRGVALLAGSQYSVKLVEEKQGATKIVGYRFPEDGKYPNDADNLRFNFSPCFFAVGNQFVFCSTIEFAHELVDLLDREAKEKPERLHTTMRSKLYAHGGAEFLHSVEDLLLTQFILAQALEPEMARKQVKELVGWVRRMGVVRIDTGYDEKEWHFDVQLILDK